MIILLRQKTFSAPCRMVISLRWAFSSVNLCVNFILSYENNCHMTGRQRGRDNNGRNEARVGARRGQSGSSRWDISHSWAWLYFLRYIFNIIRYVAVIQGD